jgi:uncharacterized protein YgbK (DUF1537 family)
MSSSGFLFGVVADDLTGGVEIASALVTKGVRTDFRIGVPDSQVDSTCAASVVALKSRVAPANEAVEAFRRAGTWLWERRPAQLFYKYCATFDSTNEGNIGCCADTLVQLAGADRLLFCPAYPEGGRTVYNGHLFYQDVLISNSPKRHDPLTPMLEPDLRRVLSVQTQRGVGHLPWRVTAEGLDAMRLWLEDLVQADQPYVIADAIDANDLQKIAELTADWKLMSGNTTIASCYPEIWKRRGLISSADSPATLERIDGPGAVLAGSCSEQTLQQLAEFQNQGYPMFAIDLLAAFSGEDVVRAALEWAAKHMGGREFAISTAASPETVACVQERIGRAGGAKLAEEILSRIAAALVERGVNRLVVAGGETSGAVVSALGLRKLNIGPHIRGSIPLATTVSGPKLGLCLKSGKLGAPDVFAERLRAMLGEA